MVEYRRNKPDSPDAIFFLTMVTYNRAPIFQSDDNCVLAHQVMKNIVNRFGFTFKAWVILPDHFHWLIKPGNSDYSKIVTAYKRAVGIELKSRDIRIGEKKLWQPRFWEHTIITEDDYETCVEYIHYNPVKHGFVKSPSDWQYSSFMKYVEQGLYPVHWADGGTIVISGSEYDK